MVEIQNIVEKIYEGMTPEQIEAIKHIGTHARVLAGPGTGKTETIAKKIQYLILSKDVEPEKILVLTFTRLAAAQLRDKVKKVVEPLNKGLPSISTIHSFALKQILFNSNLIDTLPKPLRVADDWEERNIIFEDIKKNLNVKEIDDVRVLFRRLSADWETLRVEEGGWEEKFPNAKFIGAWKQHRNTYGYTLRAELVYQLKKLLNQVTRFKFDKEYKYLVIDEFQDLNSCELAVVRELEAKNIEIFVVGDDDQSIYGFRYAHPDGIRQFPEMYKNTKRMTLSTCFRCDKNILKYSEMVADLDTNRLPKKTKPKDGANDGYVELVNFKDQYHEAKWIAKEIKEFTAESPEQENNTKIKDIAILLRGDTNGAMSKPLIDALKEKDIKVSLPEETEIKKLKEYTIVLSYFKLIVNLDDKLALRTLIQEERNGFGEQAIDSLNNVCSEKNINFYTLINDIKLNPSNYSKIGDKLSKYLNGLIERIGIYKSIENINELLTRVINDVIVADETKQNILSYFNKILSEASIKTIEELVKSTSVSTDKMEQETLGDAVSILTMHQAKGLTFDVCFIVGVEDQFIPGKNNGEKIGDERRLLYVSMTRAKHKLYMSYCDLRKHEQSRLGNAGGKANRTLSRFLTDIGLTSKRVNS